MTGIAIKPATPSRWDDLEELFGPSGAYSGCWCMWFRQSQAEYSKNSGAKNKTSLQELVTKRKVPGLLAYVDGSPAGWVSVAPRSQFVRVERSPILKPIDDQPAWSIVCLFVGRPHRGRGVARALIQGALEYAKKKGASVVEAYPIDLSKKERTVPSAELFVGTLDMFERAGFEVTTRRKDPRPIVRRYL